MADVLAVDIAKRYPGGATVEAAWCVTLEPGGVLVLFGPSGSGKTTVLRAVAGLDRPDRGSISWGDEVWYDSARGVSRPPQARPATWVSQDPSLFPHLTVAGNVGYGLAHVPGADREARVATLLAEFELTDLALRFPRQLSGGQAQRVALARALACRPALLLLDEPLAALDEPARRPIGRLLRRAAAAHGTAVVLVTHDRTDAIALGDQMAVLAEGRIRQVGAVLDVLQRPAGYAVARALGVDSVVPCRVDRVEEGLVQLVVGTARLLAIATGLSGDDREVFACIRAEDVTLALADGAGESARNHLRGHVVGVEPEGPVERVFVDCGFPLVALVTRQARAEMRLAPGAPVVAAIKATAIHLVARS